MYRFLLTDKTFKDLNIPISAATRKEMDNRTRKNGKLDKIFVWKGYILIGYEQYDLCLKYHRFISTKELFFPRKSDAIAWICHRQLEREDLIWTARAWLICHLYEALREIEKRKNAKDEFQYRQLSPSSSAISPPEQSKENIVLLNLLGEQYHCNRETIRRYVQFGRRLDLLNELAPGIRTRILTGTLEVTIKDTPALIKMSAEDLQKISDNPNCKKLIPPVELCPKTVAGNAARHRCSVRLEPGIKNIPEYDPDAELNGLTYTIMAWIRVVKRTIEKGDFQNATKQGKENLFRALRALASDIVILDKMLEEQGNE